MATPNLDADLAVLESRIRIMPSPDDEGVDKLRALARAETLSLFDASCLDLAAAEGAALASRDGPLPRAARDWGVTVYDLT